MKSNGIKYATGSGIIAAALFGLWAIVTWEFEGEFPENEFTIDVCNCDESVRKEVIENELGMLLRFIEKDDKSGNIDFLVPRVNSGTESFLIPQIGMSWFSMQFAPVTYRMEYRDNDEAQFFNTAQSGLNPRLNAISTSILNTKCDSSDAHDFIFFVERQRTNDASINGMYSDLESLIRNELIPKVNSGLIDAGSRIRVEFGCRGGDFGCVDETACNFSAEARVDDGTCLWLDECGVCGGLGIPPGTCDCSGRVPISGYDCAGNCLDPTSSKCDADNDGVPDAFDECPNTKAQVPSGNGCPFKVELPGGEGSFIFSGKKPDQFVRCKVKSKSGKLLAKFETVNAVFPFDLKESKTIMRILGNNLADLSVEVEFIEPSEGSVIWAESDWKNVNFICRLGEEMCAFQLGEGIMKFSDN
ncbi:MAG: hypothetical protein O2818_00745 [Bacteroidetes bacterium]|nr:hypothetical protein [Bacteroidota bacterium]MDA1335390.1 hypothetical protein [Bacteroidota bacterium]